MKVSKFRKYYIYTCKNKDGLLESHYYMGKIDNPHERYTYVGSADLSQDFFKEKKGGQYQYLT